MTTEFETQDLDNELAKFREQYDRVGNVAAEQKNQKENEELVDNVIQQKNPFQNIELDDVWIEDDPYDSNDPLSIVETLKKL